MADNEKMRVIGYIRVSTDEQAERGVGLDAQRTALERAAESGGWRLVRIAADEGASGKALAGRPGLAGAITDVEDGRADAIAVAKLDRLSRSLLDFAALMERSKRRRWALIALDLGVDTTTPQGEMMANVLAVFAQFERRLIGQRTKEALAVRRVQGVRLGRPVKLAEMVRQRILAERDGGAPWSRIASGLNADGVPTAHGSPRWQVSTVRAAYLSGTRTAASGAATG